MLRRGIVAAAVLGVGAVVVPGAGAENSPGPGELKLCAVDGVKFGAFWADGPTPVNAGLASSGCIDRAVEPGPYRIGFDPTSHQRPCGFGTDAIESVALERPGLYRVLTAGRPSARTFVVTVAANQTTLVTYELRDSCLPGR